MTEKQRIELDAWKASQLAKAPSMDEATARRVSVALFGSGAPPGAAPARTTGVTASPSLSSFGTAA